MRHCKFSNVFVRNRLIFAFIDRKSASILQPFVGHSQPAAGIANKFGLT
jgi:hypothetical protein